MCKRILYYDHVSVQIWAFFLNRKCHFVNPVPMVLLNSFYLLSFLQKLAPNWSVGRNDPYIIFYIMETSAMWKNCSDWNPKRVIFSCLRWSYQIKKSLKLELFHVSERHKKSYTFVDDFSQKYCAVTVPNYSATINFSLLWQGLSVRSRFSLAYR